MSAWSSSRREASSLSKVEAEQVEGGPHVPLDQDDQYLLLLFQNSPAVPLNVQSHDHQHGGDAGGVGVQLPHLLHVALPPIKLPRLILKDPSHSGGQADKFHQHPQAQPLKHLKIIQHNTCIKHEHL